MPFLQKSEYFCTICIISRESACFVYYDIVHFSFFAKSEYRFEDRSFSTLFCTCRLDKSIHESEVICLYSPSTGWELRFERVLLFIVSICRLTTVDECSVVHREKSYFGDKKLYYSGFMGYFNYFEHSLDKVPKHFLKLFDLVIRPVSRQVLPTFVYRYHSFCLLLRSQFLSIVRVPFGFHI